MKKVLAQGAEAVITLNKNQVTKSRVKKSYRLLVLDEKIRKLRTRSESKLIEKASRIIPAPKIISTNENTKEIVIEFIDGKKLSEHLDKLKNRLDVANQIGQNIAKLHDENIIHGDLTTSNMILKKNKVYFIDFGLGFISQKVEDKATDLHLIKEALEAKHFEHFEDPFEEVLKGYKTSKNSSLVLERLKKVEARGRYKAQY